MHRLTALVISLALLVGLFVYAPQSVRALELAPRYIGPGGGSGECGSPFYETNGSADNVLFQTAVNDQDSDIDNILYVCPGTYDIKDYIEVGGDLTIESVAGAAATVLDSDGTSRILYLNGDSIIRGLTFKDGDADGGDGGAIRSANLGDLTVEDSVFVNNQGFDGGAIFADGFVINIRRSTFTGNSADGEGGAIMFNYDLDLVLDSTFTNNHAEGAGGAIYVYDDILDDNEDGESGLFGNTFSGNTTDDDGGAVYVNEDFESGSQMIDNVFSGNTAGDDGGAVMIWYDMKEGTLISGNTFSKNKADLDNENDGEGGGLQIDDLLAGTITNNRFLNNEAGYGGGLYSEDLTGTAVITMNTFRSNVATADGGGIWLDDDGYDSSELAIFTKNSFRGNRASDNGGALYLSFTNTEVGPSFFTRNMYRGNRAALGGAIAFKGFGSVDVGEVAGDCSAPLRSSRIAVRIFKKDRFVSNRATRSRRTANVGLMACEADLR